MIAKCDECKNTIAIYEVGILCLNYDEINLCAGCYRKLEREFGSRIKINNKIYHLDGYIRKDRKGELK